jgi:transposase
MDVPACPGCRERDARIAEHEARIAALEEELRRLKALVQRNASNSSVPPSANPPGAAPPVTKPKTGRRPGGQPGHPPHLKRLLPLERVQRVVPFVPKRCKKCATALPAQAGANDPEPTRHQVADLPPVRAEVIEYQGHARTCPCCGEVTRASIPEDIRRESIGPNLAAAMAYLAGCHQVSKRGVEEISETLFEVPVALGKVSNLEHEMSEALAAAHAEAVAAVQAAPVKHVDETGWKKHGKKCWLWVAATPYAAVFMLHSRRNLSALTLLLGDALAGIIVSDRWSAYFRLPVHRRQLCWAHLQRDFQALVDLGGKAKPFGEQLLAFTEDVFYWWSRVRDGTMSRSTMLAYINEQRPWLRDLLTSGCASGCAKTAGLCGQLLKLEPAMWTFVRHAGVEPTNNRAERALRKAVLWRKKAFGCVSDRGCRFVERILTVVQTLRQQGRPVWQFLRDALHAHRSGQAAPMLLRG